jgi:hypothetical protein
VFLILSAVKGPGTLTSLLPLTSYLSLVALSYRAPKADLAVVDPQIEPAIRVGADPGFVGNRRAFAAVIGKWNEGSLRALLTGRPLFRLHASLPPAALGPAQALPYVGIAEDIGELVDALEVGLMVARLGHQESDFH